MSEFRTYSHQTKAGAKAKKDQRMIKNDQRRSKKHQRKFSLTLSLDVNGPLAFCFELQFLLLVQIIWTSDDLSKKLGIFRWNVCDFWKSREK